MFANFTVLVEWILSCTAYAWNVIMHDWGSIGVFIIGLVFLRRFCVVFKRLLFG